MGNACPAKGLFFDECLTGITAIEVFLLLDHMLVGSSLTLDNMRLVPSAKVTGGVRASEASSAHSRGRAS